MTGSEGKWRWNDYNTSLTHWCYTALRCSLIEVHVITKTNAKCMFYLTKEVSFSTKLPTTAANTYCEKVVS